MNVLRPVKHYFYSLKMYVYDVYRFVDAKIMIEQDEKKVLAEIQSVREELQEFSDVRSQTMDRVNEGTTPTQLEDKLTEFEVTLTTDVEQELEDIRSDMQAVKNRMRKTNPPVYHEDVIENLDEAIDVLQNTLERNVHIMNSVMERLDRQVSPLEIAAEIKEFKTGQESQELGDIQSILDNIKRIFDQNSFQSPSGWKNMLSPTTYRSVEKTPQRSPETGMDEDTGIEEENLDFDSGGEKLDDGFGSEDDLNSENGLDMDFDDDF